jgi:type IV pilus assembly protein PilN
MIRVNLLAAGAPGQRAAWIPEASRPALAGCLVLLCTAAALGGWYWLLTRQTTAVEARVAASEQEIVRLKQASTLVERAIARKTDLASRLSLIERLRAAQRGPVAILSTISRSLPDGLWLLELNERGGTFQIEGRAASLTSVTDFAERLQSSGSFERPVEIVTTSMEQVEEQSVVRFALKAQAAGTTDAAAAPPAPATARKGD